MKLSTYSVAVALVALTACSGMSAWAQETSQPRENLWSPEDLKAVPKGRSAQDMFPVLPGQKEVLLAGPPWQGKPTWAAAIVGLPKDASVENPVPGVVLVHGGGGSALKEWVRSWTRQGFAAIAVDLEGNFPVRVETKKWKRNPEGGPPRKGIFHDYKEPVKDQWMYHAISLVLRARNYLSSLPEVEDNAIGLAGVSWGSIISGNALGYADQRFAFGVLAYGCGFLDEIPNMYGRSFKKMDATSRAIVNARWNPSSGLAKVKTPLLWVNWAQDKHFLMPWWEKSAALAPGTRARFIDPELMHGHGPVWKMEEPQAFAQGVIKGDSPLPDYNVQAINARELKLVIDDPGEVEAVRLFWTVTPGENWPEKEWQSRVVEIKGAESTVPIPDDAVGAYVDVTAKSGLRAASAFYIY